MKNNESIESKTATNDEITLLSFNTRYFSGNKRNGQSKEIIKKHLELGISIFNNVDIVLLQELDKNSDRSHNINQYYSIVQSAKWFSIFDENYNKAYVPYPIFNHYGKVLSGQATFSKYKLNACAVLNLPKNEAPYKFKHLKKLNNWISSFYPNRIAQISQINWQGHDLIICNMHLENKSIEARINSINQVLDFLKRHQNNPVIIAGDFNCVDRNQTYLKKFHEFKADSTLDILKKSGFESSGFTLTFPSNNPSIQFDYIFYNSKLTLCNFKSIDTQISDHLPIISTFKLQ